MASQATHHPGRTKAWLQGHRDGSCPSEDNASNSRAARAWSHTTTAPALPLVN
ncbi:hypothetical protein MAHJHV47_17150 [Mycobacterium avium subsp. hominissuis]